MLLLHIKPSGFQLWIVFMGVTVTLSLLQWRHAQNPSKEQEYCDSGLGGDLHVFFCLLSILCFAYWFGDYPCVTSHIPSPSNSKLLYATGKNRSNFFPYYLCQQNAIYSQSNWFQSCFSFSNHWVFCPKLWDDSFCQQHNVVFIIIRNKDLFWKLTSW